MNDNILLDCDGVIADFATPCFELIYDLTGDRHTHDELTSWDVFDALGKSHLKEVMHERVGQGGWCEKIPMFEGAYDFVCKLRDIGNVIIVTAPMPTPTWCFERTNWLKKNFNFGSDQIIFAKKKSLIHGRVFIDDSTENCVDWFDKHVLHENSKNQCIMFKAPYNHQFNNKIVRENDYEKILDHVRKVFESKDKQ